MDEINVNDIKRINERAFQRKAEWQCERSAGTGRYVPCGRPATHVIEWRHQDGDRERRILCQEHTVEEQKYWSEMDWDTSVEVSDIEDWRLGVCYRGWTATRVGSRFRDTAA